MSLELKLSSESWDLVRPAYRFVLHSRVRDGEPGELLIDGRVYRYSVHAPAVDSGVVRHVRLYKGDDPFTSRAVYDCAEHATGCLECDCPDWLFRRGETGDRCKHLRACDHLGLWSDCPARPGEEIAVISEMTVAE